MVNDYDKEEGSPRKRRKNRQRGGSSNADAAPRTPQRQYRVKKDSNAEKDKEVSSPDAKGDGKKIPQ